MTIAIRGLVLLVIAGLAADAALNIAFAVQRAWVPAVWPAWSEGPLLLEMQRIAAGQPAYTPPYLLSAYDYGPVYPYVVNALRSITGLAVGVVPFRATSMTLGFLSALPLSATAFIFAQRLNAGRRDFPAGLVAALAAGLVCIAVITRTLTFSLLHPDNLTFLLLATIVAIYFAIASSALTRGWIWALVALGVAATFSKQNTVIVVPVLLLGLAIGGATSWRLALAAIAVFGAAVAVVIATMPSDMRAWVVLVPLAHTYQFGAARIGNLFYVLARQEAYLGMLLLAAIPFGLALPKRQLNVTDGAALAAVAIAGLAAFFKRLGVENNLLLFAAVTIPYAGALIGDVFFAAARRVRGTVIAASALGLALVALLPFRYGSPFVLDPREARHVDEIATRVCSTGRQVIVLIVLPEFFGCPTATFALDASLTELRLAYPRYDPGPTLFDRQPTARYVVAGELPLPLKWLQYYEPFDVAGVHGEPFEGGFHVSTYVYR
jgi:hypothetical protein